MNERTVAAEEYTRIGTLILETESASRLPDYQNKQKFQEYLRNVVGSEKSRIRREKTQVDLLRNDASGFALLAWWEKQEPEEELKQAVLRGRQAGVRRFRQLYLALLYKKTRK